MGFVNSICLCSQDTFCATRKGFGEHLLSQTLVHLQDRTGLVAHIHSGGYIPFSTSPPQVHHGEFSLTLALFEQRERYDQKSCDASQNYVGVYAVRRVLRASVFYTSYWGVKSSTFSYLDYSTNPLPCQGSGVFFMLFFYCF